MCGRAYAPRFLWMWPNAQIGVMGAEQADEYIKGKRDFPQKVPVAVELVTQENIAKYTAYGRESEQ